MKRRIYLSIFLTGFLTTILVALLTVYAFYGFFVEQTKTQVRNECEVLRNSINLFEDNEYYLNKITSASIGMRLTLITPDGEVTFDSEGNLDQMGNHNVREEVTEARINGYGEAVRHSETIEKDTVYYAFLLSDDYVLRGSKNLDSITGVFLNILPIILAITILLTVASFVLSNILTKKLMKPVESAGNLLQEEKPNLYTFDSYQELTPFLNKLSAQQQKIKEQIQVLKKERDTIQAITENMQEGLLIIDSDRKILSVNKGGIDLLNGSNAFSYIGKNVISLLIEDDLLQKLDSVLRQGERINTIYHQNEKQSRIFMNPVYEKGEIAGAVIILVDITNMYKAEQIRREFSANVSHELKTPLTSISGFAEMMSNGIVKSPEDMVKFANNIHKEASRLLTLIEDIIRLTEIEENTQVPKESVDLLEICQETIRDLTFAAQQKQVRLWLKGDRALMEANRAMISEMIYNLVDNGIKYNKPSGVVEISVTKTLDGIRLSVKDNGIGIPKEHLERVFERFYRVDKSRSKQNGGTGLGLSIVKHVAGYHNGTISIDSEVGKGTEIVVVFP